MSELPKIGSRVLAATILNILATCPLGVALAQEGAGAAAKNAQPGGEELNEIVVTATRRNTVLQNTPVNITAVSPAQIQEQRINDIRSLTRYVPGISTVDQGPRSQSQLVARGIVSADASPVVRSNEEVATYLGEVPLFVDFKLIDIDRVEVLLGPQGTLYGAGTLAGAVRYLPNRPDTNEWSGEAHSRVYDLAHGSGVGFVGDATLNVPLVPEKLAFRTASGYYRDPGFIDQPLLVREPGVSLPQPDFSDPAEVEANLHRKRDVNDERTFTTRNSLLFRPMDAVSATLTYAFQQTRSDGRQTNSAGVLDTGRYENAARVMEPMKRKAHMLSLELEADLGDFAHLTSSSAGVRTNYRYASDLTDEVLRLDDMFDYGYGEFPSFTAIGEQRKARSTKFVQEIRLNSLSEGPFSWILGGFYSDGESHNQYYEYTPGLPEFLGVYRPDHVEFAAKVDSKSKEEAVFGELSYRLTPKWQVTGGVRYYRYSAHVDGGFAVPLVSSVPYPDFEYTGNDAGTKADGFVYKANTSYEISDDLFAYATYSTGYRLGGGNQIAPCPEPLPDDGQIACGLPHELSYDPDRTKNIELGLRSMLWDRRLTLNVAVFHIDWTDLQLESESTYGAVGITINAGGAVSKGIETTFSVRPIDRLTINGSYAYTDAHLTEDAPQIVRGEFDAFSGDRLPQSPKHAASLVALYEYPLANDADLIFNWSATYKGATLSTVGARGFGERIPDNVINDASVTYHAGKWEVALFADNIFDKYYVTGISEFRDNIGDFNGYVLRRYGYTMGRPRTVGIESRIKF